MAAHLKTGLEQVLEVIVKGEEAVEAYKPILQSAVDLDCWTADNNEVWAHIDQFLRGLIDFDRFRFEIGIDLRVATLEWEQLGQPRTREAWYTAKYDKEK